MDDRKYFDQYRAFRLKPLVRLSILAPGLGRDRKRSDIALQTSDRSSQRRILEQEITEIKNGTQKKDAPQSERSAGAGPRRFRLKRSRGKRPGQKPRLRGWRFFETKTRNSLVRLPQTPVPKRPSAAPRSSVLSLLSLSPPVQNSVFAIFCQTFETSYGPFPPLTANLAASVCGREWPDRCPRSWQQHPGSSPVVGWCECALLPVAPD